MPVGKSRDRVLLTISKLPCCSKELIPLSIAHFKFFDSQGRPNFVNLAGIMGNKVQVTQHLFQIRSDQLLYDLPSLHHLRCYCGLQCYATQRPGPFLKHLYSSYMHREQLTMVSFGYPNPQTVFTNQATAYMLYVQDSQKPMKVVSTASPYCSLEDCDGIIVIKYCIYLPSLTRWAHSTVS